jgi:serine/tyrosine/threonine adenylyltransferase
MHYLGVPTSRAASLVVSNETIVARDPLYTGAVRKEKCAVVLRVAPTFIRFGTFQIFLGQDKYTGRKGPSHGLESQMLPDMLEYTLNMFYPHIAT